MHRHERPKPPADYDDNPEWTAADFGAAMPGPHWSPRRAASVLRDAAKALRAEADALAQERGA